MEQLSEKMLNFAPSFPVRGWRHEESYLALTRQRIWKIQAYGREAEKAVPPTVACIACSHQELDDYIPVGVS